MIDRKKDGLVIRYDTLVIVRNSLIQCHEWVKKAAIYSHPKDDVRIVLSELELSISMLDNDVRGIQKPVETEL